MTSELLLPPLEGQSVQFWTNRMILSAEGIKGKFKAGEFWSHDMADRWSLGEVAFWAASVSAEAIAN